jgi:hypothetical protein
MNADLAEAKKKERFIESAQRSPNSNRTGIPVSIVYADRD